MIIKTRALAATAILCCFSPCGGSVIFAQTTASPATAPQPNAARMALDGYWGTWKSFLASAGTTANHKPVLTATNELTIAASKLQPWAQAKYAAAVAQEKAGKFVATAVNKCFPADIAGLPLVDAYSFEILVEPRQVAFLAEGGRTMRFARIGGRHPADLQPSWTGDSVARWEGDTLVVDTVGFNDRAELPHNLPMTPKMHIVERLRVVDGTLEDQATYDDPGAFTAPFAITTRFTRSEPFQEYICAENNREGGVPTATGQPTRAVVPGIDRP